jgi:hypothetical protein
MKNDIIESLEEVIEMKETVWNDFLRSGYESYTDFIENDVKELKLEINKRLEKSNEQLNAA